ncbi:MAG: hypothetical protein N2487_03350 [Verrucomicrobiae bacterium]|nr:hypothetical protein [Verrucomicrobiae bacterium]
MKRVLSKAVLVLLLFVAVGSLSILFAGCGTVAEDSRNVSSRPWNAPKTWEGPLPSTINEGR